MLESLLARIGQATANAISGPHCRGLKDGLVHLCFPAPHGGLFRLEASQNLRDWSSSFDLTTDDGTVHIVDEATPGAPVAFRRIISGP